MCTGTVKFSLLFPLSPMSVGSALLHAGLLALGDGILIPAVSIAILLALPVVLYWSSVTDESCHFKRNL